MAGFKPRTSGIGSDRSTNCATTSAQNIDLDLQQKSVEKTKQSKSTLHLVVANFKK